MEEIKRAKTIQHGRDDEEYHCRQCNFSDTGISNALQKARNHNKKTGHTVDVYYETWREVTNKWHNKKI